MRGGEAAGDLARVLDRLAHGQRSGRQPLAERIALQELHDRIGNSVLIAEVVDGENVRMGQRRHCAGLALEASQGVGIPGHRIR